MLSTLSGRVFGLAILTWFSLSHGLEAAHAVKDLAILDASFASQVIDRHPLRVSRSAGLDSLTDSRLWFWIQVSCRGECERKMLAKRHVKIFLDWYLEEDGVLRKQLSLPLSVKETTWRTWGVKRVIAGAWRVVVRAEDSQWVCLKDQCDFAIDVREERSTP